MRFNSWKMDFVSVPESFRMQVSAITSCVPRTMQTGPAHTLPPGVRERYRPGGSWIVIGPVNAPHAITLNQQTVSE